MYYTATANNLKFYRMEPLFLILRTDDIVASRWFSHSNPYYPFIYYDISSSNLPYSFRLAKNPSPRLPNITRIDVNHLHSFVSRQLDLSRLQHETARSLLLTHPFWSLFLSSSPQPSKIRPLKRCLFRCGVRSCVRCVRKTRQAFKLWSVLKMHECRNRYSRCNSDYQRELRQTKSQFWPQFGASRPSSSDLFSTLILYSGKANNIAIPPSILINGTAVTDSGTVLENCANNFPPKRTTLSSSSYFGNRFYIWEIAGTVCLTNPSC